MLTDRQTEALREQGRHFEIARTGDPALGPLQLLPGTWANEPTLRGRGWNMIALPFPTGAASPANYRLLLNQYNETLKFNLVDKAVANRGIVRHPDGTTANGDEFVVALDYEQSIKQTDAEDFPVSGLAGAPDLPIHHEPGLFLHMPNSDADIARLATVPHGDVALALGKARTLESPFGTIAAVNALPIGVDQDLESRYLAPYKHFHDNPFNNLFDPTTPTALLDKAVENASITRTTVLELDTRTESGGISNIPFIVRQANAAEMKSTFWIHELTGHTDDDPKLLLQYLQIVNLDFFPRRDGHPGLIAWPHISINTLAKVSDTPDLQYGALE